MDAHADMWDPNTWENPDDREYRIYADDTLEVYALVSAIDYPYLCQFKWSIHTINRGKGGGRPYNVRKKFYLRRGVSIFHAPDGEAYVSPIHGHKVRHRNRTQKNIFLHQEVMERKGDVPPTPDHDRIDHIDRDTFNCRRENLKWETASGNSYNTERSIAKNSMAEPA